MNPQLLALHNQVHEKFTNEWTRFNVSIGQESERLRAAQNGLLAGEPAIKDEMARLEAVRDVCRNVSRRVGAVVNAADAAVTELKRKGDPEVDELVCATTIVHNQ
jgi:ESCRT-I complex subunit TSG101